MSIISGENTKQQYISAELEKNYRFSKLFYWASHSTSYLFSLCSAVRNFMTVKQTFLTAYHTSMHVEIRYHFYGHIYYIHISKLK